MRSLALRLAAGGGSIDGHAVPALVAAGFTLLQRSPALVRAFGRGRSAIILPPSPQVVVALAASDGRGALLLDPNERPEALAQAITEADVRAILTIAPLTRRLPAGLPHVLLDAVPARATVVTGDGTAHVIDLGSHFGLSLEGTVDEPGLDEECVLLPAGGSATPFSHRAILDRAVGAVTDLGLVGTDEVRVSLDWMRPLPFVRTVVAPLLAGAALRTPGARA